MDNLLDILGSTIIAGIMFLMLFQVNAQISLNSMEIMQTTFTSRNAVDASNILEYDFNKLGYGVANSFITTAEENRIEFLSDIGNNDKVVSVLYYLGNAAALSNTTNPNDRPLYRKVASDNAKMVSIVRDFKITYLDSVNNPMSYASLTNQANRDKIRGTQLYFKIEPSDPVDGVYPYIEFKRTLIPTNLGRKYN